MSPSHRARSRLGLEMNPEADWQTQKKATMPVQVF